MSIQMALMIIIKDYMIKWNNKKWTEQISGE